MQLDFPRKKSGLYILNKVNIENIATMFLQEYSPSVLMTPKAVNIEFLAEEHLDLTIQIKTFNFSEPVLGLITFSDVEIQCYDIMYEPVSDTYPEGTVLVSSALIGRDNIARRRFTITHECAHWILHRSFYSPNKQHFEFRKTPSYVACRNVEIDKTGYGLKKDEDWIEWQAEKLAASILMPISTFTEATRYLFRKYGINRNYIVPEFEKFNFYEIVHELSETFNVSHKATQIRLRQLDFIKKSG